MPEVSITHRALGNLAQHCAQEARYFEQEGEHDNAAEFKALAEQFDEAYCTSTREITLCITDGPLPRLGERDPALDGPR